MSKPVFLLQGFFFYLAERVGNTTINKSLNLMYDHRSDLFPDRQKFTKTLNTLIAEMMDFEGLARIRK